jgi:hypothetical protein
MLNDAKFLLSRGMSIIPIKGRDAQSEDQAKSPAVKWDEFQTRKPSFEEVEKWFKFSRYNIALVTGAVSRVLVLDIDERHGGSESIKGKFLPITWCDKSPNGSHYYFLWTPQLNLAPTSRTGLLPGVDTRGNGGYVIIPPSVGYNGQPYVWTRNPKNTSLAYPPPWLLELLVKKQPIITNQPGWIAEALTTVSEGNRNNTFTRLVGRMWHDGWQADDIYQLLLPKAQEVNLAEDELDTIVKSISKYARNAEINLLNSANSAEITKEDCLTLESFMSEDEIGLKWFVEDVIPEESVTILGGMQGLGKTWLMLDLAIELARGGGSWMGKYLVHPARVLYIDEESSGRLLRFRLKKLLSEKGLRISDLNLHLAVNRGFNLSDSNSTLKLKSLITKLSPQVIFIDSLVRVHRANENFSTEMAGVFSTVKQITKEFKCSVIFSDHEHKGVYHQDNESDPSSNDLRGSNEKGAFADTVLSLRKKDGELYLYHTKSRFCEASLPFLVKIEDTDVAKTKLVVKGY